MKDPVARHAVAERDADGDSPTHSDPTDHATGDDGAPGEADGMAGTTAPRPGPPSLDDIRVGRWDVLCVGPILAQSAYAFFGQPITPALLGSHPVLASFLRGSIPAMLLTGALSNGGGVPLWQAILAPLLALSWVDPFLYWAGRRYGRGIFDYYSGQGEKMRKRIVKGEAWFARYGIWGILFAPYIPVSIVFYIAAGESRMNFWKFIAADVAGNLIWISMVVTLGWTLGKDRGEQVASTITQYATWLTIASVVIIVVIVARQVLSARRSQTGPT